jgi:hypothetical protein
VSGAGGRFLGIDFSGNAQSWRPGRARNVWIAEAVVDGGRPVLRNLLPVQDLAGEGPPFRRLVARLQRRDFAAAAIDAPFSLPASALPAGTGDRRAALLREVATMPLAMDRPFPSGRQLVAAVAARCGPMERKPRRLAERQWPVNVRSTLWDGPRGGAPFTAACLHLIAATGRDCWPWVESGEGLLVEAFPTAQLRVWGLPHQKYGGVTAENCANRRRIVEGIGHRITCSGEQIALMQASADALDAVLCCFAGMAVLADRLARPRGDGGNGEGWIAVHA